MGACKAAAKAMKKKFASSGAYASLPKGCFLLNNQFYYNKGKTGKGNSKARAVCVSGATGGKKPAPKFAMAGNGKANCGKLKAVATEKACRASTNRFYYNKAKAGKANKVASLVCVKTVAASNKPTKKLVLAANGKANCAGKGAPVKNEAGCKAAA